MSSAEIEKENQENWDHAELFLETLEKGGKFAFQTFPDAKERQNTVSPCVRHGTLERHRNMLEATNHEEGAGVFVMVNEGDGNGRRAANVTRIRAVFLDIDEKGADLQPLYDCELPPHIIVESSEGKYHAYWLVDHLDLDEFKTIQKGISHRFDGDAAVHDLSRVMRLPGFWHQKNSDNVFLTKIIDCDDEQPKFTAEQLRCAFPLPEKTLDKPSESISRRHSAAGAGDQFDQVRGALEYVEYDYSTWIKIGQILKREFGDAGFNLWDEWSSRDFAGYKGESDLQEKWTTFDRNHPNAVGLGTLFYLAKKGGYVAPKKKPKASSEEDHDSAYHPIVNRVQNILGDEVKPNVAVLTQMAAQTMYNPQKHKFTLIHKDQKRLISINENNLMSVLRSELGVEVDYSRLKDDDRQKAEKAVPEIIKTHILHNNQFSNITKSVDIFSDDMRIELHSDTLSAQFPPLTIGVVESDRNDEIVKDFKQHFAEFDDVIDWIAYSRFASDRKQCYLWLRAPSDFGKNLLFSAIRELEKVVEIKNEEVKKLTNSDPSARHPDEFLRAWVLVFNEVQKISAPVKELESNISISPKNQMAERIPVYAKLFTSRGPISSLQSDTGVEEQYRNRFSFINKDGCGAINDRHVFQKYGKNAYRKALTAYIAERFQSILREMRTQGYDRASQIADDYVGTFQKRHDIGDQLGKLEDSVPDIAREFLEFARIQNYTFEIRGCCYVEKFATAYDRFLNERYSNNQFYNMKSIMNDVDQYLFEGNKGVRKHYQRRQRWGRLVACNPDSESVGQYTEGKKGKARSFDFARGDIKPDKVDKGMHSQSRPIYR